MGADMTVFGEFMRAARRLAVAMIFSAGIALPAMAQTNTSPLPGQTPVAEKERIACVAKGGKIRAVCRSGRLMCVVAYPDAGKACTDNSQCASNKCVATESGAIGAAASGKCKVTNDPCGCTTMVKNGKRGPTVCVD